jgi:hypothetical protein
MRGPTGQQPVIEGKAAQLLRGRYALIVAMVDDEGAPFATRGWGLTLLPHQLEQVRLVLGAEDGRLLQDLSGSRAVAITAGDPRTLHSVQFKGRAGVAEPATDDDQAEVGRYCDAFFGVVTEVDGTDRRLLERLVPDDFIACTVVIDELYDQTPGPGAGAPLQGTNR